MEVSFGGYALPVVLTVLLSFVYRVVTVGDRWKAPIAIACGIALGMVGLAYKGLPWSVVNIVDHVLYGFMTGAGAVGIYEMTRSVTRPRS